ncbi:hypothetical protein [Streptomyces populi]|uniref:hypothetical protein n=1 Tax=Streptomyces populi TaxID=2058924 RepID=UPI001F0B7A3A|nr:hypothetical protein [Streptomyces populi]
MSTRVQPGGDGPAHTPVRTGADLGPGRRSGVGPDADLDTSTSTSTGTGTGHENGTAPAAGPGRDGRRRIPRPGDGSARARRSAPHPLRAEWLRGFAPWAGAGLLLALAWPMAARADQWQGSWGATTELLSTAAAMIGVPFALAAGGWQGGRERRRRTAELRSSTARTPLVQLLAAALPLACWLTAAHLLVVAGALAACAPYASAGGPAYTVFAGNALTLAACTVLGHTAGRAIPFRLTAPLLAIGGYVVVGALGTRQSDVRHLAFCMAHVLGDNDLAVRWYPLVSALWAAGLAAAAALALTAYRRATALLPLAAALGAAVLLVSTGDGLLRDNPLAHRQVCDTSTTPDVCVNATYPGMLPEVTRALSGLTGRLEGVRNLPVRYEDLWRSPHPGEAQLPNLSPLGWSVVRGKVTDPRRYAWEAAHMLVRPDCEQAPTADRITVTDEAVLRWLAPEPGFAELREFSVTRARQEGDTKRLAWYRAEDEAYARLTSMSEGERRSWLGRYFATAAECGPKPSEVPSL